MLSLFICLSGYACNLIVVLMASDLVEGSVVIVYNIKHDLLLLLRVTYYYNFYVCVYIYIYSVGQVTQKK